MSTVRHPSARPSQVPAAPVPPSGVDTNGRALPVSDQEWASRQEWLTRELAAIDAEDDTPDEVYREFFRGIDEERERMGRPRAFGGPV